MNLPKFSFAIDRAFVMEIGEKALGAAIILLVTWALAKGAKWTFAKLVDNVEFFKRGSASGDSIGAALGKIVSGLVWVFGLIAVLNVLELGGPIAPLQTLATNVMEFIPNLIGAGLIFFIGMMIARIVRDIVVTALQTANFDKWANMGGVDRVTGNSAISKTLGAIVYVLIAIPVAILALEALKLESVSQPASEMLRMIFDAIPRIFGAAVLLGIGYVIARFVAQIAREILPGLGVDRSVEAIGILPEGHSASEVIARIAQVAVLLTVAIMATRLLGFPELTAILNEVLALGGKVIFGAVVIAVGFLLANMIARIMSGSGGDTLAATIVKWATITLFTFMGLNYTGVGEVITGTAFTAIVVAIAVAAALAFGLGGREWAARKLEEWDRKD